MQLSVLKMKGLGDIRYVPNFKPLFTGSGKKALSFEVFQFFVVSMEVLPAVFALFWVYVFEPLTHLVEVGSIPNSSNTTLHNSTDGLALTGEEGMGGNSTGLGTDISDTSMVKTLDPVGYSSVVFTGLLAWAMACSFSSTYANSIISPKVLCMLIAIYVSIVAACFLSVTFFAGFMEEDISFYVVDIPHVAVGYILWQVFHGKVNKIKGVKVRYERVRQVGGGASLLQSKEAAKIYQVVFTVILPMVLGFVYLFVIIPSFQSSSSLVQCIIRVFGHTFIKGQSDVRQRDGFARNKQSKTVKAACGNMFAMECV